MEWAIYLLLASSTLFVCVVIFRICKNRDEKAMAEEIDRDFAEEFQRDGGGELTDKGMEDMLDWLDEQDEAESMEGLEEIKDPRAIPPLES